MNAAYYIKHLGMQEHPEGGYYVETFRSNLEYKFEGFDGKRSICTSIFFLMTKGRESALHRVKSDEIWYFHDGDSVEIFELDESGKEISTIMGKKLHEGEVMQYVIKANRWFGARLKDNAEFCLVGCQMSPGFEFKDFELKQK